MGNNNVTGQQGSEEPTYGVAKIVKPSNDSPGPNSIDGEKTMAVNEKEGTQDEQVTSDQNHSSPKIEGEKNRGSIQDNTTTQDDQSNNAPNEDRELVKDVATAITINPTEIVTTVSTTIEDVISVRDSLVSSEKIKQVDHGTRDRIGESTIVNSNSLLDENLEGSLEDGDEVRCCNLVGKDSNELLVKGHIAVSTIEDHMVAMQGEITSSTELIVSTYHDADDSEIKEVVKPGQMDKPSNVQPLDATNIETSKGYAYTTEIQQEKEEISAFIKTATIEPMIESDEVIDEDHPEYSACEVEHELNERVVSSRKISNYVTATVGHTGIERIYMNEEEIADKTVAVHNIVENFEKEKEPEEYDDQLVSPLKANGNSAYLSSSHHLVTVNEEKEKKINEILECDKDTAEEIQEHCSVETNAEGSGQRINAHVAAKEGVNLCNSPMIMPSTPVLLLEDFEKMEYIKFEGSDSNEGTTTSTYGTRPIDAQDTIASSQGYQSQWQILEEPEVVKLEKCEILSSFMQVDRDSLKIGNILTDDSNHEKAGANASATPVGFTFESNQEGDITTTTVAGFTAEGDQVKVTESVDKTAENNYHLQTSTPVSESSEETPLLQIVENIGCFSNSNEQHSKVRIGKPVTDISAMQCKAEAEEESEKSLTDISAMQCNAEAEEESEKSPLLSPRCPSGEDLRAPNRSARKIKPFQNLLAEGSDGILSPLKEQQSTPSDNNVLVNSPRSKGKQKTRSSLFTNCMCCVTPTN